MLISVEWLREFVELPSTKELCDRLMAAGMEIDAIDDPGARVRGVVVGKVLECGPHPNADKLKVCKVTDGSATFEVVCGAPNVAAGQLVPFARVGADVSGMAIAERAIRGVTSRGMLCSRKELGLSEDPAAGAGLWLLPETTKLGADALQAMGVDPVLTLSISPVRPDLLSHLGVAREVAAATGQRLKSPAWRLSEKGPEVGVQARVVVEDPAGCDRYLARVIQGIKVGPSPAWLRQRLERVGQRSVNNVVDATNYVLFELGQPLHAFDLARLGVEGNLPTVRVRRAKGGEKLITLDGVTRSLRAEDLVIADPHRVLALAGVMGGADSEVSEATTSLLLESAHFDAVSVRRSARHHGMHTEASRRFERGADPGTVARAADRCAQLLAEIADGKVCKGQLEVAVKAAPAPELVLRLDRVPRILGIDVAPERVVELLEPLDVRCTRRSEGTFYFRVPSFRQDLTREIDLIEEIARRQGYEAVPERLPSAAGPYAYDEPPSRPDFEARAALLAAGCSEVVTYGFGAPAAYAPFAARDGQPLRIQNPLGEELSALRTSLLPGLLTVLHHNQRHGAEQVRLFEVGHTFHAAPAGADAALPERDRGLPVEQLRAGVLVWGGRHGGRWYEHGERIDFSDVRGVVEALLEGFDPAGAFELRPAALEGMHPHAGGEVVVGDTVVGTIGQVHPARVRELELQGSVFVAEIDVGRLAASARRAIAHRSLPRFPGTRRDVAVVVDRGIAAEAIRTFLQSEAGGELGAGVVERVRTFDVYRGKPIPDDKVSLAFAIDYRSPERTLTDDEVGRAFAAALDKLKARFALEIR